MSDIDYTEPDNLIDAILKGKSDKKMLKEFNRWAHKRKVFDRLRQPESSAHIDLQDFFKARKRFLNKIPNNNQ